MCIFESRLLNLYKPSHKHIGVFESTPQLPNTKKDKKRQKKYIGFFRFWLVFSTTQKLWKQSSGSFFPCLGIRASRVHLLCGTEELLEGNRLGVQPGLPEATLPFVRLLLLVADSALFLLPLFAFLLLVLGRSSCSRLLRRAKLGRARLRRAKLRGARLRPLSLRLRPLCVGSRGRRHDERSWHACLLQALVPAGFVVRPCPKHHGTVARAAAVEAFAGFVLHHPCEAQAALAHAVSRHILERTLGLHALSKETAAAMLLRA